MSSDLDNLRRLAIERDGSDSLAAFAMSGAGDEIERLRSLLADAIEDETEFETEWNKAAREALQR